MKSKHAAFYKKYEALKSQEEKLEFMKQYALSLPPEEALDFLLGGIRDFGKFIRENKFTPEQVESLDEGLGECIAMLQKMKERHPVEAV